MITIWIGAVLTSSLPFDIQPFGVGFSFSSWKNEVLNLSDTIANVGFLFPRWSLKLFLIKCTSLWLWKADWSSNDRHRNWVCTIQFFTFWCTTFWSGILFSLWKNEAIILVILVCDCEKLTDQVMIAIEIGFVPFSSLPFGVQLFGVGFCSHCGRMRP